MAVLGAATTLRGPAEMLKSVGGQNARAATFVGGKSGSLSVVSDTTISGQPIARVDAIEMIVGVVTGLPNDAAWALHGVATNDRYTTRAEKTALVSKQAPIGRPEASRSALILLRKRAEWWALTQDARRKILRRTRTTSPSACATCLLSHGDCFTAGILRPKRVRLSWLLDYAPESGAAFDEMLDRLRATKEWAFKDREIDIRLTRT